MSRPGMSEGPVAALTDATLTRRQGPTTRTILDRVDVRLLPGRLIGLSGASGSGKSRPS